MIQYFAVIAAIGDRSKKDQAASTGKVSSDSWATCYTDYKKRRFGGKDALAMFGPEFESFSWMGWNKLEWLRELETVGRGTCRFSTCQPPELCTRVWFLFSKF